jgi:hypothetical protein
MQSFNLTKIHSDNGPCFKNMQWIKLMASLNIQIVNASALNPSSRGKAERAVQQVKLLMKKFLSTASSDTLNWELLPFLVSKIMNHTRHTTDRLQACRDGVRPGQHVTKFPGPRQTTTCPSFCPGKQRTNQKIVHTAKTNVTQSKRRTDRTKTVGT